MTAIEHAPKRVQIVAGLEASFAESLAWCNRMMELGIEPWEVRDYNSRGQNVVAVREMMAWRMHSLHQNSLPEIASVVGAGSHGTTFQQERRAHLRFFAACDPKMMAKILGR